MYQAKEGRKEQGKKYHKALEQIRKKIKEKNKTIKIIMFIRLVKIN